MTVVDQSQVAKNVAKITMDVTALIVELAQLRRYTVRIAIAR